MRYFLAAAQVPGGIVRSNALFVIFGSTCLGIFVFLICCTTGTYRDSYTGERTLMSIRTAGWIAWVLMVVGSIAVAIALNTSLFEHAGHFVGAMLVSSCLFGWVSYDTGKLCERMQPDEYMQGVCYFYTDFLMVCCCCMLAGCVSSGGS